MIEDMRWLLAVGCWLLAIGRWRVFDGVKVRIFLLAIGYWLLAIGCWLLAVGRWLFLNQADKKFSVYFFPFVVPGLARPRIGYWPLAIGNFRIWRLKEFSENFFSFCRSRVGEATYWLLTVGRWLLAIFESSG
ncbi:MAG: hypothetical protein R2879_05950 [Saprospiraceae bacterium]